MKKKIQTGSKREKSNNVCYKTQTAKRNSERQKAERTFIFDKVDLK